MTRRGARRAGRLGGAAALALWPGLASAGPPFLTDDPMPTDTGHWEIYAPAATADGRGGDTEGSVFAEINYGPAANVQLTLDLTTAFAHDAAGTRFGLGDVAFSAKYRFFHDAAHGVSVAAFPAITLPTAAGGLGAGHVTGFLPVWAEWDHGAWSVFGGGGYDINPGAGNRNFWSSGLAVSRQVTRRLLVGAEAFRQGADADDSRASTSLGLGGILDLKPPFRVLASGGPTFVDGQGQVGFHAYVALGLDF